MCGVWCACARCMSIMTCPSCWHTIGMERKKCRRQSREKETYANRDQRERRQTIQPLGTPFGYIAPNINCTMSIFSACVCVLTAVRQYESGGQRDYIRMRCAMSLCILHVSQLNFWMYALDGRVACVYTVCFHPFSVLLFASWCILLFLSFRFLFVSH